MCYLKKTKYTILILSGIICSSGCKYIAETNDSHQNPNIILILADDLGYGDISALNTQSKIITPNIDRLVSEGIYFTDAHAPASVCTPTRYGILTGRYCFRSRLESGVLVGHSPSLIESGRLTIASLLKKAGYYTGCIGKWHLGLDWKKFDRQKPLYEGSDWAIVNTSNVDYSARIDGGPCDHGFDFSYILPSSLDIQPYCYVSNKFVVNPKMKYIEDFKESFGIFWRHGDASTDFNFWNVMPEITSKACEFIQDHHNRNPKQPFFLYFPLTAPHSPWVPIDEFRGRSEAGDYGDFVIQVDHAIGQVINMLDNLQINKNTIVIVTSDNGAYWREKEIEEYDHRSNYIFRGMKSDVWEGGHRMPFIVRWPDVVEMGNRSDQLVCLTDFLATFAELTGVDLPYNAGEDSFSFLHELNRDLTAENKRDDIIMQSGLGMYSIRRNNWKLIFGKGSGGWSSEGLPDEPPGQLYNLKDDPGETNNLYDKHTEIIKQLTELFEMYLKEERSRYE